MDIKHFNPFASWENEGIGGTPDPFFYHKCDHEYNIYLLMQ